MERLRQVFSKVRLFLSDSDRRKFVLLLIGFLVPFFWFAVDFDDVANSKEAEWKLKAGAFTTTVIGMSVEPSKPTFFQLLMATNPDVSVQTNTFTRLSLLLDDRNTSYRRDSAVAGSC